MDLDKNHGKIQWIDVTKTEMVQLDNYDKFRDIVKDDLAPPGYNKIWVH